MRALRWLILAGLQIGVGLCFAALTASDSLLLPASAHALAIALGLALAAGGVALGLAPPFLGVETEVPLLGELACASAFASDILVAAPRRVSLALAGLALLLMVAHLPVALARRRGYEGEPILGAPQPFRVGDRVAAAALGVGVVGILSAGAILAFPPRDVPTSALALLTLVGVLPLLLGGLVFLLPRIARTPLSGATVVVAALLLETLGAAGLAFAYADPLARDFRWPATSVAAGLVLGVVGLLRVKLAKPDPRFLALRPLGAGAATLAILAAVLVFLAMAGGRPGALTGVALDLVLALAAAMVVALAVAAGPLLFEGAPRLTRWPAWAAGLLIAGLFLIAPAAQYDRSAFPGVVVDIVAFLVAVRGLWPMVSSARGAMARP